MAPFPCCSFKHHRPFEKRLWKKGYLFSRGNGLPSFFLCTSGLLFFFSPPRFLAVVFIEPILKLAAKPRLFVCKRNLLFPYLLRFLSFFFAASLSFLSFWLTDTNMTFDRVHKKWWNHEKERKKDERRKKLSLFTSHQPSKRKMEKREAKKVKEEEEEEPLKLPFQTLCRVCVPPPPPFFSFSLLPSSSSLV